MGGDFQNEHERLLNDQTYYMKWVTELPNWCPDVAEYKKVG